MRRPCPFVLVATNVGSMIVNRNDFHVNNGSPNGYGVGFEFLTSSQYCQNEVDFVLRALNYKRATCGDGVVSIDGGANIGAFTIPMAVHMSGWGEVISFEAQQPIFHALAGNVAINNCFNVHVNNVALGEECGSIGVPLINYNIQSSFGSLELKHIRVDPIGQPVSYANTRQIPLINLDSLNLDRLDFMKLDVEGMEMEVLRGAENTINKFRPVMFIETYFEGGLDIYYHLTNKNYLLFQEGINHLAVPKEDSLATELLKERLPSIPAMLS